MDKINIQIGRCNHNIISKNIYEIDKNRTSFKGKESSVLQVAKVTAPLVLATLGIKSGHKTKPSDDTYNNTGIVMSYTTRKGDEVKLKLNINNPEELYEQILDIPISANVSDDNIFLLNMLKDLKNDDVQSAKSYFDNIVQTEKFVQSSLEEFKTSPRIAVLTAAVRRVQNSIDYRQPDDIEALKNDVKQILRCEKRLLEGKSLDRDFVIETEKNCSNRKNLRNGNKPKILEPFYTYCDMSVTNLKRLNDEILAKIDLNSDVVVYDDEFMLGVIYGNNGKCPEEKLTNFVENLNNNYLKHSINNNDVKILEYKEGSYILSYLLTNTTDTDEHEAYLYAYNSNKDRFSIDNVILKGNNQTGYYPIATTVKLCTLEPNCWLQFSSKDFQ